MVNRGMPSSADLFWMDYTGDCITDAAKAWHVYRLIIGQPSRGQSFTLPVAKAHFPPPQHCCLPWQFNIKAVLKFHFHCLHGVARVRSFMKADRCHQPLLDGIRTLINSHVWNSTAHCKVISQLPTPTNPRLPTPVTCHSIGTPLVGTQILAKYRGGTPTSRPLCITTRVSPIKSHEGNNFFSLTFILLYLYLLPSFFSYGWCNPFISHHTLIALSSSRLNMPFTHVLPFFYPFYTFISILASCIFLSHPFYTSIL
jgi:hypothetical protein